jgi:hypothetical protein
MLVFDESVNASNSSEVIVIPIFVSRPFVVLRFPRRWRLRNKDYMTYATGLDHYKYLQAFSSSRRFYMTPATFTGTLHL